MEDIKKTLEEIIAQANRVAPRKRHRLEESHIQCACVNWFRLTFPKMRHSLFAVPNGAYFASNGKIEGGRLKSEGLLPGVADLILLRRNSKYGALLIEMKTRTGRQQVTQREWQKAVEQDGYKYVICRSLDDFRAAVSSYVKEEIHHA